MSQPTTHTALRLFCNGSLAVLQPKEATGPTVDTLSIDLNSGSISASQAEPIEWMQACTASTVFGVLGVCKLHKGGNSASVTPRLHLNSCTQLRPPQLDLSYT